MTAPGRPPAVDTRWLARLREEIIDPTLPIIDCHHHLWDLAGYRYFLDDLLADLETGHNIEATVFVQCGYAYFAEGPQELRPIGETQRIAAIAQAARPRSRRRIAAAIVGFADLQLAESVDAVLEAHIAAAGGSFLLRSIQRQTVRLRGLSLVQIKRAQNELACGCQIRPWDCDPKLGDSEKLRRQKFPGFPDFFFGGWLREQHFRALSEKAAVELDRHRFRSGGHPDRVDVERWRHIVSGDDYGLGRRFAAAIAA